jgi:hypothetical protein
LIAEEVNVAPDWSRVMTRWIKIDASGKRSEFNFAVRMYSAVELAELMKSAGFSLVQTFGDLSGIPYDNKAKRLVAVATR